MQAQKTIAGVIFTAISSVLLSLGSPPPQREIWVIGDFSKPENNPDVINLIFEGLDKEMKSLNDSSLSLIVKWVSDDDQKSHARRKALDAIAAPEVLAVIGHSDSDTTSAALELYGPQGMPLFIPLATVPDLMTKAYEKRWHSIFRLVPNDHLQARFIVEFCQTRLQIKKSIVIAREENDYGRRLGQLLQKELVDSEVGTTVHLLNMEELLQHVYPSPVTQILGYDPGLVICVGYQQDSCQLMKDLQKEYAGPIFLTEGFFKDQFLHFFAWEKRNPPKDIQVYSSFYLNMDETSKSASRHENGIKQAGNSPYDLLGADLARMIHKAAKAVINKEGVVLNRESFLNSFRNMQFKKSEFHCGKYRFNEFQDNGLNRFFVYILKPKASGSQEVQWSPYGQP